MNNNHRDTIEQKAEILKAIGSPVRLCILGKLCRDGEQNVTDMRDCIGASQPVISQHLRKLKDMGIVKYRKDGTSSYYSMNDELVKEIVELVINWR